MQTLLEKVQRDTANPKKAPNTWTTIDRPKSLAKRSLSVIPVLAV